MPKGRAQCQEGKIQREILRKRTLQKRILQLQVPGGLAESKPSQKTVKDCKTHPLKKPDTVNEGKLSVSFLYIISQKVYGYKRIGRQKKSLISSISAVRQETTWKSHLVIFLKAATAGHPVVWHSELPVVWCQCLSSCSVQQCDMYLRSPCCKVLAVSSYFILFKILPFLLPQDFQKHLLQFINSLAFIFFWHLIFLQSLIAQNHFCWYLW